MNKLRNSTHEPSAAFACSISLTAETKASKTRSDWDFSKSTYRNGFLLVPSPRPSARVIKLGLTEGIPYVRGGKFRTCALSILVTAILLYEKFWFLCVFNFFSKRQTSRHLRMKSKIIVQDRNFYRYKCRFSPPKVIQVLILPSRMLIVNLRGVMEKIRNGEV